MGSAFFTGLVLGASLIIAIGAQNAFILRQGLLRQHVFILCLICACSDAALIAAGVAGLGTLIQQSPTLLTAIRIAGALFLLWYAWSALTRAFNPAGMETSGSGDASLQAAILTVLAFTFLNPHVYLDTVILIGSLSAPFSGHSRLAYASGAMLASFIWFFSLGYGARLLVPLFQNPKAWQILDLTIAIVMATLAVFLLLPLAA